MAFLDELRRYLEQPGPVFEPDAAAHRKHLVHALKRLEQRGASEGDIEHIYSGLSGELQAFATFSGNMLLESFCKGESEETLASFVNIALDREVGLDTTSGSKATDLELDRIRRESRASRRHKWRIDEQEGRVEVERYALEIGAVRRAGAVRVTTAIGKLILDLPVRDALRWMLAVEVTQSHGASDPLRLSRSTAASLLETPSGEYRYYEGEDLSMPAPLSTMGRLSKLGLMYCHDTGRGSMQYGMLDDGRPLLQEIASGKDTPFILLAKALLQDETDNVIGQVRPAALAQSEGSAAATARHARMVAHEIRNALVPVQSALEALYRDIEREGGKSIVDEPREAIDGGIGRIFRFLRDISRIADLASVPSELLDVVPAVRDAIAVIAPDFGGSIAFETPAPLPAVRGNRERLVLAIVNVLRNAAQSRAGVAVTIEVSAGTNNGAEVFIAVDDDGPGVPPEHRASVFEPGFSLRTDGTGQGLALVREVVEIEMLGRAVCEASLLGGARFVLRLPVGARRNK